ncbi:MAG: aldose epimerase family protein [Chitinophagaceae bacterium]
MPVQQRFCFKDPAGEDIYLFTLTNQSGTTVTITNYGAIISSFTIRKKDGSTNDIVLGFDDPAQYLDEDYLAQYPWFGCAVGRYANRIKNGEFELDGKKYPLTKNRGEEQLHGGWDGFGKRTWRLVNRDETPCSFLELRYLSREGEEGFPGNLETIIRFELSEENELSYEYKATTDQPTPVNLTHHSYFNLNNGEGTIDEHEIRIHADEMLEQEENLTATGNILPVAGTPFDFREFRQISEGLTLVDEYDKSFVVNKNDSQLVSEARSAASGLYLQIYSTEPIVHFYSGKWIPGIKGKMGTVYGPFFGFCLETHTHPNAVNFPHFPNTILRPGETYYQKTVYKVIPTLLSP